MMCDNDSHMPTPNTKRYYTRFAFSTNLPVNVGFGQLENALQRISVMYVFYSKITTMQPNHRFYHHSQLLLCWLAF